jgi:biopolymer transport protein TolR
MQTRKRNRRSPLAEINVVPYIDVMLVLLVIFMITAPLLSQGVQVDLPHAASKPIESKNQDPIIVSVNAKGQYFLNINNPPDQVVDATTLMSRVSNELQADRDKTRQVLVKGDQSVDYGHVVQAMVLLQRAGAQSVGLVTQEDEQTSTSKS